MAVFKIPLSSDGMTRVALASFAGSYRQYRTIALQLFFGCAASSSVHEAAYTRQSIDADFQRGAASEGRGGKERVGKGRGRGGKRKRGGEGREGVRSLP